MIEYILEYMADWSILNSYKLYISTPILIVVITLLILLIILMLIAKGIAKIIRLRKISATTVSIMLFFLVVGGLRLSATKLLINEGNADAAYIHDVSASITIAIIAVTAIAKSYFDNKRVARLQNELMDMKAKAIIEDTSSHDSTRKKLMHQHFKVFATSDTYRDMSTLYDLKAGEIVSTEKRKTYVSHVLAAYYDMVLPIMTDRDLTHDDIFVCLMYYMNFTTRQIAACLGVTEEAVRKRKSRMKQKLKEDEYNLFFVGK
ncbi:MAG: hypothetical protein KBT20_05340 [Bacteroidales bacterium]|nr:hypothetical protein [Candidatus Liminaster caballi]